MVVEAQQPFGGRLKLRHLILLVTIADEGSFVRAAEALYVSQPAVTRSVHELEDLIGMALFVRGPRGVLPTTAGEILIERARSALGSLRRASEQIEEVRHGGARPLRVGTNLAGAYALLPQAIVAVKQTHPEISVSVLEGTAEVLATSLQRSEVDLLVGRLDPGTYRGALHHIRLYDEAVRAVVRRGHPALSMTPQLADLLSYPWILPLQPSTLRTELDEMFATAGLKAPRDITECSTLLTSREIVLQTDSIAPLPMLIGVRDDLLDMLPLHLDTVPRAIGITLPADRSVSREARVLVDALTETARLLAAELRSAARKSPRLA
ncbi:LysR substrate-binding domain-containing protein [Nonomuraea gerenzanensis]|uniref:Galactose-binding protein regulator n=1 Tax=Nonomuraea gerenzanensis TaxID=93944 RepID=A0A1M4EC77_9ACTN|nr:LysR substrate-binding domain-containing protein [Nonomuraea gerenzanensis]UBU18711.1 LysR family transcriptional regulator [Nonomuraea gerenzanensis]SBO96571.1 Galactose-binding protein regulator [Nonomuraea gerenzanensis]